MTGLVSPLLFFLPDIIDTVRGFWNWIKDTGWDDIKSLPGLIWDQFKSWAAGLADDIADKIPSVSDVTDQIPQGRRQQASDFTRGARQATDPNADPQSVPERFGRTLVQIGGGLTPFIDEIVGDANVDD